MSESKLLPIARGHFLRQTENALTKTPQVILSGKRDRRHTVEYVKRFGIPELHHVPQRRAEYYPVPADAYKYFSHSPASYCNAYIQEISGYRMKNMWAFYMHSFGRWWYRFAVAWWTWVWPFSVYLSILFAFAYRNQRIQRVRTWN